MACGRLPPAAPLLLVDMEALDDECAEPEAEEAAMGVGTGAPALPGVRGAAEAPASAAAGAAASAAAVVSPSPWACVGPKAALSRLACKTLLLSGVLLDR
jgi:hypothetical protein